MGALSRTVQIIRILGAVVIKARYRNLRAKLTSDQYPADASRTAAELKAAFIALGGAFVKFGQLLAMRPDLLPQTYIDELSTLLDRVPPFPNDQARQVIVAAFGQPVDDLFVSFSEDPVAAASFSQVYQASLLDGSLVAVKVQRPGVADLVRLDIVVASRLTSTIDFLGVLDQVKLRPIIDEFAAFTNEELDYTLEGAHIDLMSENSEEEKFLRVPKVYWDLTNDQVLTTEFLTGNWVSAILKDIDAGGSEAASQLATLGTGLDEVAANIFNNALIQAFRYGFFHADPHAGNLIVVEGGAIAYIDFGIVGYLDSHFRTKQLLILEALRSGDVDSYAQTVLTLLMPPPENVNLSPFVDMIKRNVRAWLTSFYNPRADLRDRSFATLFSRNLIAARKMGLSFQTSAIRYYRAISVSELIVLKMNPSFQIRTALSDFARGETAREATKQLSPAEQYKKAVKLKQSLVHLPEQISLALGNVNAAPRLVRKEVNRFAANLCIVFSLVSATAFILALLCLVTNLSASLPLLHGPSTKAVAVIWFSVVALISFVLSRIAKGSTVTNRMIE